MAGTGLCDIGITARAAVTCAGAGTAAHVDVLRSLRTALTACRIPAVDFPCYVGEVRQVETCAFPAGLGAWDNRASRLAVLALEADDLIGSLHHARETWGAHRVGLVVGTSTSGIERLEEVYRAWSGEGLLDPAYSMRHHNDHHAVTSFLSVHLGIGGPAYTISTACSSSAKAMVDAAQLIQSGLCDAVLAGGVDSLCLTSIFGFESLELVSRAPCRPFDLARDGLTIGEGAGFALLERGAEGPRLIGYGESSDAINMSTPPEDGAGARQAMAAALRRAGLTPEDIDWVKMHGTATPANDQAETRAVDDLFETEVPAMSFKALIGHTLGAAGGVETVMALDALEAGLIPGTAGLGTPEAAAHARFAARTASGPSRRALLNAFGFGGSNCALVLEAA